MLMADGLRRRRGRGKRRRKKCFEKNRFWEWKQKEKKHTVDLERLKTKEGSCLPCCPDTSPGSAGWAGAPGQLLLPPPHSSSQAPSLAPSNQHLPEHTHTLTKTLTFTVGWALQFILLGKDAHGQRHLNSCSQSPSQAPNTVSQYNEESNSCCLTCPVEVDECLIAQLVMEALATVLLQLDLFDVDALGHHLVPLGAPQVAVCQYAIHCNGQSLLGNLVACLSSIITQSSSEFLPVTPQRWNEWYSENGKRLASVPMYLISYVSPMPSQNFCQTTWRILWDKCKD